MHAPELKTGKEGPADRRIDTRGLLCPYPFIEAKQALEALPPGSTVEILTDSEPTATSSIPILCERSGYTFTSTREGELWVLVVEKP
jgi:tRNA 2-thiouridine synthesizing protein A